MNYVEIAELVFENGNRHYWCSPEVCSDEQFNNLNQTFTEGDTVSSHNTVEDTLNHILLIAAMEGEL